VPRRSKLLVFAPAIAALIAALALTGCVAAGTGATRADTTQTQTESIRTPGGDDMATIYLAGGCFWGVEHLMASIPGVTDAESGYANGSTESPTYEEVCSGRSGHAEAVKVEYDPEVAPLPFLLDFYYRAIDPTSVNRQGNDVGTQYRTGIYYVDESDRPIIERSLAKLQESYSKPIAIELEPLTCYTTAEEYHQDYLDTNPGGYCHIEPGLFREAASAKPAPDQFPDTGEE